MWCAEEASVPPLRPMSGNLESASVRLALGRSASDRIRAKINGWPAREEPTSAVGPCAECADQPLQPAQYGAVADALPPLMFLHIEAPSFGTTTPNVDHSGTPITN